MSRKLIRWSKKSKTRLWKYSRCCFRQSDKYDVDIIVAKAQTEHLQGDQLSKVEQAHVILPRHIAVIMDGNGRWAKSQGKQRYSGHQAGVKTVKNILRWCMQRDIQNLTLFAFSSENWNRPKAEVKLLMELLANSLSSERAEFLQQDIRLRVIGDVHQLPKRVHKKIMALVDETSGHTRINLNIAINYGGKWDIAQAAKKIAQEVAEGDLSLDQIDEHYFESKVALSELDAPDLLIRTGGESRISNFLLWQLAYAELYFCDEYWPDFNEQHFQQALNWFSQRQRRFGKTGEQVEAGQ